MPNNAPARRGKQAKIKGKKAKESKETDTSSLPKEDEASADGGTLSLSSAGQDQATSASIMERTVVAALAMWHEQKAKPKEGNLLSLTPGVQTRQLSKVEEGEERAAERFSLALNRFEEAMQDHAAGRAEEPDIENAEWSWAITALRREHSCSLTVLSRSNLSKKVRGDLLEENPKLSGADLKARTGLAMLQIALEWRRSTRQAERDSLAEAEEQIRTQASLLHYERALTRPQLLMTLAAMEKDLQGKQADTLLLSSQGKHDAKNLLLEHSLFLTDEERKDISMKITEKLEKSHPNTSREERKIPRDLAMLELAMEWRIEVLRGESAFLLAEKKKEEELLVRGPAQAALLKEHKLSLTDEESAGIYAEVFAANPEATTKELTEPYRAARLQAALAWYRKRNQEAKDSHLAAAKAARASAWFSGEQKRNALSLPPQSVARKNTNPLSLESQSKTDQSTTGKRFLSLTQEERFPIKEATKRANPNADDKAFNLAYKVALCKAEGLKGGVSPLSWEDVEFAPISDTYSEDGGQDTSDDELKLEG